MVKRGRDGEPLDDGYDHNIGGRAASIAAACFARRYDAQTRGVLDEKVGEILTLATETRTKVLGYLRGTGRDLKDTRAAIMLLRGHNPQLFEEVERIFLSGLGKSSYGDLNDTQRGLLAERVLQRYSQAR